MRVLLSILVAVALSACALTTDEIDVPYQGAPNLAVVDGANAAKFTVSATDARTVYRDRVSVKKNGYGMEMAPIIATNDIAETVRRAIEQELSSLGFTAGPGGADIEVELDRFYNDFKSGFWSGDAVADMAVNVKVFGANKTLVFSKHYEGGGIEQGIQLSTGDNARLALIKAMRNTVATIINDTELQKAIFKAQQPATTAEMPMS